MTWNRNPIAKNPQSGTLLEEDLEEPPITVSDGPGTNEEAERRGGDSINHENQEQEKASLRGEEGVDIVHLPRSHIAKGERCRWNLLKSIKGRLSSATRNRLMTG